MIQSECRQVHLAELSEATLGGGGVFLLSRQQLLFLLQLLLQSGQRVSSLAGLNEDIFKGFTDVEKITSCVHFCLIDGLN